MKKVMAALLVMSMALSMVACGSKETAATETAATETTDAAAKITSIDDLAGKKIGVQTGTTGDIYASDEFGEENIERYNKGFEAVQALMQGKVDAVVIDDQPAQTFVSENEGLAILDEAYTEEDYAICVSKENTELTAKLNEAMAALKEDGTFQAIVDYYIEGEGTAYEVKDVERANGTLTMGTNAEFPPYEFYDGQEIVGIDADMARAMADYLGMELVIEDMAFDSIIVAVQGGKVDIGCAGMTITEDRLKSIDFTDSYYTGRQVVIVME